MDSLTYKLTREQLEAKRSLAEAYGITMNGDSGTAGYMGVSVSYVYDPSAQELTLKVLHKPFFYPDSLVLSNISKVFNG